MSAMNTADPLLEVKDLALHFPVKTGAFKRTTGHVRAVDGISFSIQRNTTLGLVGESGCGKTTAGRAILRLMEPSHGSIRFQTDMFNDGTPEMVDVRRADKERMRRLRREMQIVFQDPFSSLEPRMTIRQILREPLAAQGMAKRGVADEKIAGLMAQVGLNESHLSRFPHEFSGGQRQRIGIAKALILDPTLIIADEAVSALDVSVQAQVLNLMKDIQRDRGLTYLFISHDLGVVRHVSDRIAVMYLGRLVEIADKDALFARPRHPYSEALISAVPQIGAKKNWARVPLKGEVASAANVPSGCAFHPRCRFATEACRRETPTLRELMPGQFAACHHSEELDLDPLGQREPAV